MSAEHYNDSGLAYYLIRTRLTTRLLALVA